MQNAKCKMVNGSAGGLRAFVAFHFAFFTFHFAFCISPSAAQSIPDEFRIKRQEVFEFAEKPIIARDGDRTIIRFASKAFCDATVAIQDASGRIVRHLASGVLGPNAPTPFARDSLSQELVWDGKDDTGVYIDERAGLTVRVSLGLRPQFERSLFWEPRRRTRDPVLFAAAPEGVYVYTGGTAIDSLVLYDREGEYLRTVYPFPADRIEQTLGLQWRNWPQDNQRMPLKTNFLRCTFLTSGTNAGTTYHDHRGEPAVPPLGQTHEHWNMYGRAAQAMAIRNGRVALAYLYLNRLATDGTTGKLDLLGPALTLPYRHPNGRDSQDVAPYSAALSPDGRWLYLTGYHFGRQQTATQDLVQLSDVRTIPAVLRVNMETGEPPQVFKGHLKIEQAGSDNDHFKVPASVAVDAAGRVYVGDYMNDRVQVFSPDGAHLKTIAAHRPAAVAVHHKTGDLFVFSWLVRNQYESNDGDPVRRALTRFGPFDNPARISEHRLTDKDHRPSVIGWGARQPVEFVAEIDSWSDPVRIWIAEPWRGETVLSQNVRQSGAQIMELRDGRLEVLRDFGEDCRARNIDVRVPYYYRQRLYVNPANGRLYLSEGDGTAIGKSFRQLIEIDPQTGRHRTVQIPFQAEDMAFDIRGMAYLRSINEVGRFDPATWREVPWDYGEERTRVGYGWMSGMRTANLTSGLVMPASANWHHGGMHVSPNLRLIVACGYNVSMNVRTNARYVHRGDEYQPKVFPGRLMSGRGGATTLHVWDRHGQLVREDIVPGQTQLYGVALDERDNVYMMSAARRVMPTDPPRPYPDLSAGTLMKFADGKGMVLTADAKAPPIPLPESMRPNRPFDVAGAWVEQAEWFYGGVGYVGGNMGGCSCWNARFVLDYFARSFAPEVGRYSVAVLDSAGNVILRLGRYGNVDDGVPLVADGGPAKPRAIGGDEIALFHAPYLAAHTDHRLFIADPGNGRILSVELGYHATETAALK